MKIRKFNKILIIVFVFCSTIFFMNFVGLKNNPIEYNFSFVKNKLIKDSTKSVEAFKDVYNVLMSPRCVNCHPAGDVPLQGDDSHLHAMLPKRGKDGKGLYAMKCASCHQPTNLEGEGKPPGNLNWRLPAANMKMVFEGRTPRQLALQLINPKTNGNKNIKQLLEHANDDLVKAGWTPADGKTTPPLSYNDFKKAWTTWIENGAFAPGK